MAGRMNDKTETGLLGVVLLRSSPIALDPERKVVHREEPQYPALAGKMALHGTAKLKIWISPGAAVLQAGASFHEDPAGRNVFFGVREFAMCAALIGMQPMAAWSPSAQPSPASPTTANRPSAWLRSWGPTPSSSLPTTPSDRARTAPRTSSRKKRRPPKRTRQH